VTKAREKLHSILGTLFSKRPDAFYFHITKEAIGDYALDELVHSQGLFEQKYIVVFDIAFEDKDAREEILSRLVELQESPHVFIFLEGKLDQKTLKKLDGRAERVFEFGEAPKKKEAFNIFSLTEALGRRSRKDLWTLYLRAKLADCAPEEVHGILFWQVKSMLLAIGAKDAEGAGLNPFVYRKALGFLKNYSREEVEKLSQQLVRLSHDARRGIHDFDVALERFILAI